ncbi:MAG TPA: 50S ribosomal protein L13 [Candidatus Nanoarchaeia archaeon]|nr:50S ribosomal protein L13 [Candidatus Nanoarchaeia archaeon]
MIIDGTGHILGRVASVAAKRALLGEKVDIVNCEKMLITGRKKFLEQHFRERKDRGHPYDGPFYPKMPDRIVRRTIRGMLPYKQERGRSAYKRVMCYVGVPHSLKDQAMVMVDGASGSKLKTSNFLELRRVSAFLGKKV